jgi:hypothetical protein
LKEDAFSILHDGIITDVSGDCPGTVFMDIRCDYLRQIFSAPGGFFRIQLENCKTFYYQTTSKQERDLGAIAGLKLEILSAETRDSRVLVYTGGGELHLCYDRLTVYLNDFTPVSEEELEKVAEAYWEDWSRRSERGL